MWTLAVAPMDAAVRTLSNGAGPLTPPELDRLMLFGFLSAVATLGCIPHVRSCSRLRPVLAVSLAAQAFHAFASGAWPLGMVALVASVLAGRWWLSDRSKSRRRAAGIKEMRSCDPLARELFESRHERLFGPNWNTRHIAEDN